MSLGRISLLSTSFWFLCCCSGWWLNGHASTFGAMLKVADKEVIGLFGELLEQKGITGPRQAQILTDLEKAVAQLDHKSPSTGQMTSDIQVMLERPFEKLQIDDFVSFINWATESAANNRTGVETKHYRVRVTPRPAPTQDFGQLVDTYQTRIREMSRQMNEGEKAAYYSYWRAFSSKVPSRQSLAVNLLPMATMPEFRREYGDFFALFAIKLHPEHLKQLVKKIENIRISVNRDFSPWGNENSSENRKFVEMLLNNQELKTIIQFLLITN